MEACTGTPAVRALTRLHSSECASPSTDTHPCSFPQPGCRLNWLRSLQRQLGADDVAPSAQRIFFDPLVPGFTGGLAGERIGTAWQAGQHAPEFKCPTLLPALPLPLGHLWASCCLLAPLCSRPP